MSIVSKSNQGKQDAAVQCGAHTFSFSCHHCGACCKAGSANLITPYDYYRVKKHRGAEASSLMRSHFKVVMLSDESLIPFLTLKTHPTGECAFFDVKSRLCRIYEARPQCCRIMPAKAEEVFEGVHEHMLSCNCPGLETGDEHTINTWVKKQYDSREQEYDQQYWELVCSILLLENRLPPGYPYLQRRELTSMLTMTLFLELNTCVDFGEQFKNVSNSILRGLKLLMW